MYFGKKKKKICAGTWRKAIVQGARSRALILKCNKSDVDKIDYFYQIILC